MRRVTCRGLGEPKLLYQRDIHADGALLHVQGAIRMYVALVRRLLRVYQGYECKEPEAGKFTLTFKDLDQAIRWACHLQQELVVLPWPHRLLQMPDCKPEYSAAGDLIWAGLRVRVGMSWGTPTSKKPLNTGRADYFGVLPNRAARVMGSASYGQVRLKGGCGAAHCGAGKGYPLQVQS